LYSISNPKPRLESLILRDSIKKLTEGGLMREDWASVVKDASVVRCSYRQSACEGGTKCLFGRAIAQAVSHHFLTAAA
jgi:hypothetical protein